MSDFSESKINAEQLSRLEALENHLQLLLAELPELQPWVRRDENSPQAKRFSDIKDLESALGGWRQYLALHGSFPKDRENVIIPELEAEVERLEKG